jgi:hypothetical protein
MICLLRLLRGVARRLLAFSNWRARREDARPSEGGGPPLFEENDNGDGIPSSLMP